MLPEQLILSSRKEPGGVDHTCLPTRGASTWFHSPLTGLEWGCFPLSFHSGVPSPGGTGEAAFTFCWRSDGFEVLGGARN